MAAAQVFAIPELLESIIFQVALEAVATSYYISLEPITSLACLHRVDRTFNATIKGSPKLQRAMLSDSDGLSRQLLVNRLERDPRADFFAKLDLTRSTTRKTPLEFLFEKIPPSSFKYGYYVRRIPWLQVSIEPIESVLEINMRRADCWGMRAMLERFMASKASDKDASWRRVKVNQSSVDWERLSFAKVQFRRPKGYTGNNEYREPFAFDDGTELGEVFERYVEIINRSPSQHCERVKAGGDRKVFKRGVEVRGVN